MVRCNHRFKKLEGDIWYCTNCPRRWIAYNEGKDLYEQIKILQAENLTYKKSLNLLKKRVNLSLIESGIKVHDPPINVNINLGGKGA